MTATLDELQTQIEAMKNFIGMDGYRQGQQRVKDNYMASLQNEVADAKLILADVGIEDEDVREEVLAQKVKNINTLKRRIDTLDRDLGPGENGNRATRRRSKANA